MQVEKTQISEPVKKEPFQTWENGLVIGSLFGAFFGYLLALL